MNKSLSAPKNNTPKRVFETSLEERLEMPGHMAFSVNNRPG
jgi:GH43 family beta-xylosidase